MKKFLSDLISPQKQHFQTHPFLAVVYLASLLCGILSSLMILGSVLITCQSIWVRFVMNGSTIWQTEMVVYLMIAATSLGLPYVQLLKGHVNVDLLTHLLSPKGQKIVSALAYLATMLVVMLIVFYGFELFQIAYQRNWKSETIWGVRLWIPYLSLPVGFGLFFLQLFSDLYCELKEISFSSLT